jgi:molecular chaperone HtpG
MSLEMEKYMRKVEGKNDIRAQRVLELNPDAEAVLALRRSVEAGETELAGKYAKLLYGQALLLADLPLEDPVEFAGLVCDLMK